MRVEEKLVTLTPSKAVSAEIRSGFRTVLSYLLAAGTLSAGGNPCAKVRPAYGIFLSPLWNSFMRARACATRHPCDQLHRPFSLTTGYWRDRVGKMPAWHYEPKDHRTPK
jgi:hypothetical protein